MGCASSTRRSVRVEQEAWAGVAPGQPRPLQQPGPSPAAVAPPRSGVAPAGSGSISDGVKRPRGDASGDCPEPTVSQGSCPVAATALSAQPEPAQLEPRADQPSQPTPRANPVKPASRPADLRVEGQLARELRSSTSQTEDCLRLSQRHVQVASTEAICRPAAEAHVLSEGLNTPGDTAPESLREAGEPAQLLTDVTQPKDSKRTQSPSTAADAVASTAATTSASAVVSNHPNASSASLDVLDNSVCVAIDAGQFTRPDTDDGEVEAALLNVQRHFTRRDTFDPYEADAALRYVPSSLVPQCKVHAACGTLTDTVCIEPWLRVAVS